MGESSVSEELIQSSPKPLGRYFYYKIGNSTLSQLRKHNVIKGRFSKDVAKKKPDGLIVLPGGDVKAVIEYKRPSELRSKAQIQKAIMQELEVAGNLCKLLIVTSGKKTFWINALNSKPILDEKSNELNQIFDAQPIENGTISSESILKLEQLIDKIDHSQSVDNNKIFLPEVLDPTQLARTVWQKI